MQTVWTQIRPDNMSGLILVQIVYHSDGTHVFMKELFGNNQQMIKKHAKLPGMQRASQGITVNPRPQNGEGIIRKAFICPSIHLSVHTKVYLW